MLRWTIAGALFSSLILLVPASSAWSLDLTVKVSGATPKVGQIMAAIFFSEEVYMEEPSRRGIVPVDDAGMANIVFDGLPKGQYAVSLFYDYDSDGELDSNLIGIPTEAFGFSNQAKPRFGPPAWEAASFSLEENLTIEIGLETIN